MQNRDAMFEQIKQWQRSGIGKQRYAEQHGIKYGTFQYWCARYKEHHANQAISLMRTTEVPTFVPMTVAEDRTAEASVSTIIITLASGTRIEIR